MTAEPVQAVEYDVLTTSAPIDERTQILKYDDTFGVFDRFGDIEPFGQSHLGVYRGDTRFLSKLRLRLEGERPLLLDSTVSQDNAVFRVDLMNVDIRRGDELLVGHGALHVRRSKVMGPASCSEEVLLHNYSLNPVSVTLTLEFGADFADIFEIRGMSRTSRGRTHTPVMEAGRAVFAYDGVDCCQRRTVVTLDPAPEWRGEASASFRLLVPSHETITLRWSAECEIETDLDADDQLRTYSVAKERAQERASEARLTMPDIETSNMQFNDWIRRSAADIGMLSTRMREGMYPFAGLPWFSTAFGRDGIITALECLWMDPELARGVLVYLASTQARGVSAQRDEQPGRIIHESRVGEMATVGDVPFGRYYGSADATPLFVLLAGAHFERTADIELARSLWPHVERALDWIDGLADFDSDGFYEYERMALTGLLHQGWKDSHDPVFHADGTLAEGPIALCEVQGYVYAAKRAAAGLASALGHADRGSELLQQAEELRLRFEDAFWCKELSTYALALDGKKRPCRVVTSNAGHLLFSGIASEERARLVAHTLNADACYSGWGIRTVSSAERRYNPMSYHNGTVWPHDNAICAAGFGRYGLKGATGNILTGLFDASAHFELHRLPELFCGFPRRANEGPTLYPVACSPQAWAAGAVFLCLQASLGMRVRVGESTVSFTDPVLPAFLDWVEIRGLRVGDASVDLVLTRRIDQAVVGVEGRTGDVRVVTVK